MSQQMVMKTESGKESEMVLKVKEIKEKILEQFSLMEAEIGSDFDSMTEYFSGTRLREAFMKRMDELEDLVSKGEINPDFKVNINLDDDYLALDREVKIVFFAYASNPPHWGHLITALDALIQCRADKVVFVSNGKDHRKPDLADSFEMRYQFSRDIVPLFEPFLEFGDMAKEPIIDSSIPLIGEYSLFRFFHLNPLTPIKAYYLAGSDHLHRSVVRDGETENDTIGHLEDNMFDRLFDFNPEVHSVVALMNARDKKEFDKKLKAVVNPKVEIMRLDPTVSFSSTQLRDALSGDGHPEALFFLPHVCYKRIVDENLYR